MTILKFAETARIVRARTLPDLEDIEPVKRRENILVNKFLKNSSPFRMYRGSKESYHKSDQPAQNVSPESTEILPQDRYSRVITKNLQKAHLQLKVSRMYSQKASEPSTVESCIHNGWILKYSPTGMYCKEDQKNPTCKEPHPLAEEQNVFPESIETLQQECSICRKMPENIQHNH
ncbi:hypothetical protein TNCT_170211 [Trichonephila clavata]|uniref:Uncharacterized protein n=1 Tax=Trichonephila clavata TaxID=2740835 RepID=A0A8X6HH96_TRICU|nr:hypothetical protein TNCT_170211 [Trichonephila clavata]